MTDLQAYRLDVTETEYHADPMPEPSLSNSLAKVLITKSPRHAWWQHPRLGNGKRVEKKEFDRGSLLHKLILGKGREIAIIEAANWQTKAARDAMAEARAENKIPVLGDKYDEAVAGAEIIKARLAKMGFEFTGESEVQLAWQELSNRGPIWCRGMLDHLIIEGDRAIVYDLKSTMSAHPASCTKSILNYGYDTQEAAYTSALHKWMPELRSVDFVFLFAEHTAPFDVTPGRLDDVLRERGRDNWTRAIVEFGDNLLEQGEWPGYTTGPITFEAPGWLLAGQTEISFEEAESDA